MSNFKASLGLKVIFYARSPIKTGVAMSFMLLVKVGRCSSVLYLGLQREPLSISKPLAPKNPVTSLDSS